MVRVWGRGCYAGGKEGAEPLEKTGCPCGNWGRCRVDDLAVGREGTGASSRRRIAQICEVGFFTSCSSSQIWFCCSRRMVSTTTGGLRLCSIDDADADANGNAAGQETARVRNAECD